MYCTKTRTQFINFSLNKNIFLRNMLFILFFTDVQRKRLGRFVGVYNTMLALETNI